MEQFTRQQTFRSPFVNLDPQKGLIELKGQSILENPKIFYEPIVQWFDDYSKEPQKSTTVNIELEFFNTTSSMWIFQLLKRLSSLKDKNFNIVVNWYYNDKDMLEVVEDYQKLTSLIINKIKVDSLPTK